MRIYIAGLYSRNEKGEVAHPIEFLDNMRKGIDAARALIVRGHSPYCPFIDYIFFTTAHTHEELMAIYDRIYLLSLDWLRASEAALFLPNWEKGRGTIAEHEEAIAMGLPIYYSMDEVPVEMK